MVWAMHRASGFGDYRPDGSYAEWDDQLRKFTLDGLTEERKKTILKSMRSYRGWISQAFSDEIGAPMGGMITPSPLPEELPRTFHTVRAYRTLASMISLNDRLLAVDENMREIIEDLEPGLHRFWPIQIVMPKSQVYPRAYFGMLVGRFLESFSPEKSDPQSYRASEYIYTLPGSVKDTLAGIVLDGSVIGAAHLWRERRLPMPDLFLSDTLKSRIDAAGLRMPKCRQVNVH